MFPLLVFNLCFWVAIYIVITDSEVISAFLLITIQCIHIHHGVKAGQGILVLFYLWKLYILWFLIITLGSCPSGKCPYLSSLWSDIKFCEAFLSLPVSSQCACLFLISPFPHTPLPTSTIFAFCCILILARVHCCVSFFFLSSPSSPCRVDFILASNMQIPEERETCHSFRWDVLHFLHIRGRQLDSQNLWESWRQPSTLAFLYHSRGLGMVIQVGSSMVNRHLSWTQKSKGELCLLWGDSCWDTWLTQCSLHSWSLYLKFSIYSSVCLSHSLIICWLANCFPRMGIHGWPLSILSSAVSSNFVYVTGIGEVCVRLSVGCYFCLTLKLFAFEMISLKHNCLGYFFAWRQTLLALPRAVWCEKHHQPRRPTEPSSPLSPHPWTVYIAMISALISLDFAFSDSNPFLTRPWIRPIFFLPSTGSEIK